MANHPHISVLKNCQNEVNFIGNAMGTPDAFLQTYFSKFTQMKKRQLFY